MEPGLDVADDLPVRLARGLDPVEPDDDIGPHGLAALDLSGHDLDPVRERNVDALVAGVPAQTTVELAFCNVCMWVFFIWTWLSAAALRRFVVHVPVRSVFAIRGGSELARAVSNPLSDAAFFVGIVRLAGGRIDAVVASALVPVVSHLFIMLLQMTLALPFLRGGLAGNASVVTEAAILWIAVAACAVVIWLSRSRAVSLPGIPRVRGWLDRFPAR